jgi:hypothetical protein
LGRDEEAAGGGEESPGVLRWERSETRAQGAAPQTGAGRW